MDEKLTQLGNDTDELINNFKTEIMNSLEKKLKTFTSKMEANEKKWQ